jgi:hypothetical protein
MEVTGKGGTFFRRTGLQVRSRVLAPGYGPGDPFYEGSRDSPTRANHAPAAEAVIDWRSATAAEWRFPCPALP